MSEGEDADRENAGPFEARLRASLPDGVTLEAPLWTFIRWLERQQPAFTYRGTDIAFLPTIPVADHDAIWSHLAFVIEPDLVADWFGRGGLENQLVPLVKCGADGSHFALWKHGRRDRYVFMGAEGEGFVLSDDVGGFIGVLTTGYVSIEDKATLSLSPREAHAGYDGPIVAPPRAVQAWVSAHFDVRHGATAVDVLGAKKAANKTAGGAADEAVSDVGGDPFAAFVAQQLAH